MAVMAREQSGDVTLLHGHLAILHDPYKQALSSPELGCCCVKQCAGLTLGVRWLQLREFLNGLKRPLKSVRTNRLLDFSGCQKTAKSSKHARSSIELFSPRFATKVQFSLQQSLERSSPTRIVSARKRDGLKGRHVDPFIDRNMRESSTGDMDRDLVTKNFALHLIHLIETGSEG